MNVKRRAALFTALILLLTFNIIPMMVLHAAALTVELHPDHGPIATPVIVNGTGATPGGLMKIYWDSESEGNILTETHADDTGYYEDIIIIPPSLRGFHNVIVKDYTADTTVQEQFGVEPEIEVVPNKGPAGIYIEVAGLLVANKKIDVVFYASDADWQLVADDVVTWEDGYFSTMFLVPDVDPGTYEVRAYLDGKIPPQEPEVSTSFDVTPQPSITLSPSKGLSGTYVAVKGVNFPPDAEIEIKWDDMIVDTTAADEDGMFTSDFIVPEDAEPGKHTVEADDIDYGTHGAAIFEVMALIIRTRMSEYLPGDTISFYVNSSFLFTLEVGISDPDDIPFSGFTINHNMWLHMGMKWIVPYYAQSPLMYCPLPSDVPTGNWTWYAINLDDGQLAAEGNFTVTTRPTLKTILERLDELDVTISSIGKDLIIIIGNQAEMMADIEDIESFLNEMNAVLTDVEGDIAIIKTDVGKIKVDIAVLDLTELSANLTTIINGMARIETDIGTISVNMTTLADLTEETNAKVIGIEDDVALIKTDVGEIKADISGLSLEDLNATLTAIHNDTAILRTTLGEMEGKVTSINNNVVTILVPGIGEIQTNIEDLAATGGAAWMWTPLLAVIVLSVASTLLSVVNLIFLRRMRRQGGG